MWLCVQTKTFFAHGIRKLDEQSNKCGEELGHHVEK
jgi:hypothetical protein